MTRLLVAATVAPTIRGFLLPFADHFRRQGWTVDAMAQGAESCAGCREHFDRVWDMNWSRNPLALGKLLACRRQVRSIVAEQRYDLVHVHTPVAALVTRLALRGLRAKTGLKVIYTAHGFHFHSGRSRRQNLPFEAVEKLGGRWTDRLVVMNAEDLAAARRLRLAPPSQLMYMPGIGVDTAALTPESVSGAEVAAVRRELGLQHDEPYLLIVAELVRNKRHADAFRAAARLAADGGPRPHLVLAGGGPLRDELRQLAARLGMADRVHLLGYRRDVPALMRGSAAVLLPSEREGLPRSVMEAMCLAVPVVGADIRGTRDLLREGVGLLHPCGDVPALASQIARVLAPSGEATEMGRRGRERIRQFDIRRVIALHEQLYAEALGDSP